MLFYHYGRDLLPVVVGLVVAYILNPLVTRLTERTGRSRTLMTLLVYLTLVILAITGLTLLASQVIREVRALAAEVPRYLARASVFLQESILVGPYELNLRQEYNNLIEQLSSVVPDLAGRAIRLPTTFVSWVFDLLFVLVISLYVVKDTPQILQTAEDLAGPYGFDVQRLLRELSRVWNAFLRGQMILSLLMGTFVTVSMLALGLPNALTLGLLAAVLESIPIFGPIIAAVPAVLIALFQGSNWLTPPLTNTSYALLVLVTYTVLQQTEHHILLPRVMGEHLHLHPVVVLIGVILGANIAGILGVLLAAPTMATLRVLLEYVFRKLADQDPFPATKEVAQGQETTPPTPVLGTPRAEIGE
jgi:predicted PurR-regulated permease PerM